MGWRGQYSGTAGRIENCQVGVFLAYASRCGQALIDRRLYLPEAWAKDAARRAKAQVPAEIAFATKIEMARDMIVAALAAGVPCRWVLADALYGGDSRLRRMLEARRQPTVLAVRSNHHLRFIDQGGPCRDRPEDHRGASARCGLDETCRRRRRQGPAALRLGAGRAALARGCGL